MMPLQNDEKELWRQNLHDPLDPGNSYAPKISSVNDDTIIITIGGRSVMLTVLEWFMAGMAYLYPDDSNEITTYHGIINAK